MGLLVIQAIGSGARRGEDLPELERVGHFRVTDAGLADLARTASGHLDRMQAAFGVGELPQALLRYRWDRRPHAVLSHWTSRDAVVLSVSPTADPAALPGIVLTDVLAGHTGGVLELSPRAGLWALGFGPFVAEDPTQASTAARLAGLREADLEDHRAVLAAYGRKGAVAAGWIAWRALEVEGGAPAVRALGEALFGDRRSRTGAALIRAQAFDPRAELEAVGVSWAAFVARWRSLAQAHAAATPARVVSLPPLALEPRATAAARLAWTPLASELAGRRVEVWWSVTHDLEPYPVPQAKMHTAEVGTSTRSLAVGFDPRRRIVATWVVDGEVQGWGEVARR